MTLVIISMGVFLLAAAGLSLGLLLGRGGIRGSCRAMESLSGDACACSRNEEKSCVFSGWRTLPSTLPPFLTTTASVSRSSAWPNA